MDYNSKKFWAEHRKTMAVFEDYFVLYAMVLILVTAINSMTAVKDVGWDVGFIETMKILKPAFLISLKWSALIMIIPTVLAVLLFLFGRASSTIVFTEDSILYYKNILSKKPSTVVPYTEITECIVYGNISLKKKLRVWGWKIKIFHKTDVLLICGIYNKLVFALISSLGEDKVQLLTENDNLRTISKYYDIDFKSLTGKEQLKIVSYYCKTTHNPYKPGKEILKEK